MNQQQLKYARERAARIKRHRAKALVDAYASPKPTLSHDQRVQALMAGRFTVTADVTARWEDRVEFLDDVKPDWPKYHELTAALDREHDALLDILILGGSAEALRLLKNFEGPAA